MNKPNGVVLYDGPSVLDGKPIILVATFNTKNSKTGTLIQTWILRKDIDPVGAIHRGKDDSICGSCPLRGILALQDKPEKGKSRRKRVNRFRGCYVAVHQAPLAVYKSFHRGNYPVFNEAEHGRWFKTGLRLGSYGEPVAVPLEVWEPILKLSSMHTGYTHQWKTCDQRWSKYIMASTHSTGQMNDANEMGWRSYRTRVADSPLEANEIICPASGEAGYRETCESCGACNGAGVGQAGVRRNIAIVAHGGNARMAGINQVLEVI